MTVTPFPEILERFRRDPLSLLGSNPGLLLLDKPIGATSHDAVSRTRRFLGIRRVGHGGTLDPAATGLLLIMVGNATRLFDELQEFPKTYLAGFRLGERTDTQDATGSALSDWLPTRLPPIEREEILQTLSGFMGNIRQVPPMYSALKKDGQPLYKLARRGIEVERQARDMTVYDLRLTEFDGTAGTLEMRVSRGFYVRTLIDDLGMSLGCGAVMTGLRRIAVGPFKIEDAMKWEDLAVARPSIPSAE